MKRIQKISTFKQKGDAAIMGTSIGLVLALAMVVFMFGLILVRGLGYFWPADLIWVKLKDGKAYLGEVAGTDVKEETGPEGSIVRIPETRFKIGNRELYGLDFIWVRDEEIRQQRFPVKAITLEREEYGNFYGFPLEVENRGKATNWGQAGFFQELQRAHRLARESRRQQQRLEKSLNALLDPLSRVEREISLLEASPRRNTPEGRQELERLQARAQKLEMGIQPEYEALTNRLNQIRQMQQSLRLVLITADNQKKTVLLQDVVRYYFPNRLNVLGKLQIYVSKLWEFITGQPRESNTEGGIFPAIFGTVMMVLLMSIAVVPIGVMAAVYLSEYARPGPVVRFIRLSINNLAGVPSIVFGVFGLGFFIYMVGGTIDQLFFHSRLPEPTFGTGGILWASLTLALLTLPVVVVATEEGIRAVPQGNKEAALALGATRWQMIRKIVLPNALPGILTGLILAISRGAGEVAPLMITGVVKLAPTLPLDTAFPFLHLDRKFMHLGFHIYDLAFQSPNVEAALPMVYSTTLFLLVIVVLLNLLAMMLRNRLRHKYKMGVF